MSERNQTEWARRQALAAIAEIQRRHAEQAQAEAAPWLRILECLPSPPIFVSREAYDAIVAARKADKP